MKKPLLYVVGALSGIALVFWWQLPAFLNVAGLHPSYEGEVCAAPGRGALTKTTSHGVRSRTGETQGQPIGVFSSESARSHYIRF